MHVSMFQSHRTIYAFVQLNDAHFEYRTIERCIDSGRYVYDTLHLQLHIQNK